MAVAKLREVRNLQNAQLQEAYVAQRQARTARDLSSKDSFEIQASLEETRLALARITDNAQTLESKIHRYASQLRHLHTIAQMEQELSRLRSEMGSCEQLLEEAQRKREEARNDVDEYRNWSEDLELFFRGHGVRDAAHIVRGLQTILPSDPLPMIIRTMLTEAHLNVSSPTVVSMFDLVSERLRGAETYLHRRFQECDAAYQDANHRFRQTSKMLHDREEQVSMRLAQANCNTVATPLKSRFGTFEHSHDRNRQSELCVAPSNSPGTIVKAEPVHCNAVEPGTGPKIKRPSISSVLNGTSAALRPSRS